MTTIKEALNNNPSPQVRTILRAMEKIADLNIERRKLDEGERMHKIVEQHMSANAQRRASGILAGALGALGTGGLMNKYAPSVGTGKRMMLMTAAAALGGKAGRNIEDALINRRLKKLEDPDARHFLIKRSFIEPPSFVCAACGFPTRPADWSWVPVSCRN